MELLIHFRNGKQAKLTYSDVYSWRSMISHCDAVEAAGWPDEVGLKFYGDAASISTSTDRVEFLEFRP